MSDHIPFHIQEEIMKRLPAKSLVQFRSVSKAWKSLIDSSEFIVAHSLLRHTQPQQLLVSYENVMREDFYVLFSRCYIDDDDESTFPQQMSVPPLPLSVKQIIRPIVVGSGSRGLLCLYGWHPNLSTKMVVIWNPSIRKSISVVVPGEPRVCPYSGEPEPHGVCPDSGYPFKPLVGFGVCPITSDPKIVAISPQSSEEEEEEEEVMVYTLSSGKWRSLSTTNMPTMQPGVLFNSVVTSQFIYWDVQLQDLRMVMSFDLPSESFDLIHLPDSLARLDRSTSWRVCISKLRDSLALLHYGEDNFSNVWMLMVGHGAQKSFTKLFTITTPHSTTVGFRKNGVPIVAVADDVDDFGSKKLVVYEPNSERYKVIETCDPFDHISVHSYMDTLLLFGRSDYTS